MPALRAASFQVPVVWDLANTMLEQRSDRVNVLRFEWGQEMPRGCQAEECRRFCRKTSGALDCSFCMKGQSFEWEGSAQAIRDLQVHELQKRMEEAWMQPLGYSSESFAVMRSGG